MHFVRLFVILAAAVLATGCGVITGIYKVGFWSGVILVAVILLVSFWLASKVRRR